MSDDGMRSSLNVAAMEEFQCIASNSGRLDLS